MPDASQAMLRLEPHMIPALRTAFDTARSDLASTMRAFGGDALMTEAWLGDPVSEQAMIDYHAIVSGSSTSAHECLLAYESELVAIRDTLADMEATYRRTEGDVAELWGRRA